MKIVIDIPEQIYKELTETAIMVTEAYPSTIERALTEGIVLPKGHGDLKDTAMILSKLKKNKQFYIDCWDCTFSDMPKDYKARCDEIGICCAEIVNAPTLIEADKEA